MAAPLTLPLSPALDLNANPLAGALLDVFVTGTTTPATVYQDKTLTTAHANPVVASSDGKFPLIFMNPAVTYRFRVRSAAGVPISGYDFDPVGAPVQVNDLFPSTIAALQSVPPATSTVRLTLAGRSGFFFWLAGNQSANVSSDPQQGIYIAPASDTSGASGCWVRDWDGANGRPEWFGAVAGVKTGGTPAANLVALQACHALCPAMRLSAADYYINDTLLLSRSNRSVRGISGAGRNVGVGVPARMGQTGGTRIILTGANVVAATVCEFGSQATITGDDATLVRNSSISDVAFCRDLDGTYNVRPALNTDPTNCVKGLVVKFQSACFMDNVFSFDSPVGFHFFACVISRYSYCSAYRTTASNVATNDFTVGFLLGDYTLHFYIASNASIYLDRPTFYDSPSVSALSYGIRVFGYVSDTFIDTPEVGRCSIGIEIDGRDISQVKIPTSVGPGAHQDVRILNPIVDAVSVTGMQVRDLNASADICITELYVGAGNSSVIGLNISGVDGRVRVAGGRIFGGGEGVAVSSTNNVDLDGMYLREIPKPVTLSNCVSCKIEPSIANTVIAATAGVAVSGASYRNRIAPQIVGANGKITAGVTLTASADLNAIDPTMIDYGGFATATAAYKVRYNGADARGGASGNVLIGVTG